jgi:hypothetical protein
MRKGSLCLALLLAAALAAPSRADIVTDWNQALLNSVRAERTNPPRASRQMALVHTAIFDAVNGIGQTYSPYAVTVPAPDGASPEAAAAAAGYNVLVALYPTRQATFDTLYTAQLAAIANGDPKTIGIGWGEFCATITLELRSDDGSADEVSYESPDGAGWWIPTPPAFTPALLPNWPNVRPWVMASGDQFRGPAPPPINSAAYAAAFQEVARLGRTDSALRTADQTQIALFWNDGAGTQTPPGHWMDIARTVVSTRPQPLLESARLFALLGITVADAAIVAWDHKYWYNHWRPVTGIRAADTDGNPATSADAAWSSLIPTPPFPAYTSGHSSFSGAASRVLALFFGRDDISFTIGSDGTPSVARNFTSFSEAADEAGQSRIYGGIHWQYDNVVGLESGRALAEKAFYDYLVPLGTAGEACVANGTTLCLAEGRFEVQASWRTADAAGIATASALGTDSGYFTFFNPNNVELTVKVLDACSLSDTFWVFASGLTNVEVLLTVTDTETGARRQYFNTQGETFAPVQDTAAFFTCP